MEDNFFGLVRKLHPEIDSLDTLRHFYSYGNDPAGAHGDYAPISELDDEFFADGNVKVLDVNDSDFGKQLEKYKGSGIIATKSGKVLVFKNKFASSEIGRAAGRKRSDRTDRKTYPGMTSRQSDFAQKKSQNNDRRRLDRWSEADAAEAEALKSGKPGESSQAWKNAMDDKKWSFLSTKKKK